MYQSHLICKAAHWGNIRQRYELRTTQRRHRSRLRLFRFSNHTPKRQTYCLRDRWSAFVGCSFLVPRACSLFWLFLVFFCVLLIIWLNMNKLNYLKRRRYVYKSWIQIFKRLSIEKYLCGESKDIILLLLFDRLYPQTILEKNWNNLSFLSQIIDFLLY